MKNYVKIAAICLLFLSVNSSNAKTEPNQKSENEIEILENKVQDCVGGKLIYYKNGSISVHVINNCSYRRYFNVWVNNVKTTYFLDGGTNIETKAYWGKTRFLIVR